MGSCGRGKQQKPVVSDSHIFFCTSALHYQPCERKATRHHLLFTSCQISTLFTVMPRPSRKRTGDGPTSNDPEDLACQGKLPRGTTIAEDITVAPRSASKISPLKDFDGDGTKARATSSKTDEAKSGKLTRKKRGNALLA